MGGLSVRTTGSVRLRPVCPLDPDDRFFAALESLAKKGLVNVLSDPTIVAVSGRSASFHSGGEIPVPEQQSNGTIAISWKNYGTQLDFVPIALPHQMIRLEFRAVSSEIDPTLNFAISGTTVPALRSQEVETNAVVRSGQTLVVGDLVQTRITTRPSAASADRATEKSGQPHDEEEIREEIENRLPVDARIGVGPRGCCREAEAVSRCKTISYRNCIRHTPCAAGTKRHTECAGYAEARSGRR